MDGHRIADVWLGAATAATTPERDGCLLEVTCTCGEHWAGPSRRVRAQLLEHGLGRDDLHRAFAEVLID